MTERCSWCGAPIEPTGGFRVYEVAGQRRALFCRLEHSVAWGIRGGQWEVAGEGEGAAADATVTECSHCGNALGDAHVLLIHRRAEHSIPDGFCTVDHLVEWAKAGGRWA